MWYKTNRKPKLTSIADSRPKSLTPSLSLMFSLLALTDTQTFTHEIF